MSLCLIAGATTTKVAALVFSLSWTHSVEKTRWIEEWALTPAGLELTRARVEGSGAGMEAGEGARFDGRFWNWRPAIPPLPEIVLRRSDGMKEGWMFCAGGECRELAAATAGYDAARIAACEGEGAAEGLKDP